MSHPDLDAAAQSRLREVVLGTVEPVAPSAPAAAPAALPGRRALLRRRVREAARPVADPALDRLAGLVAGRLRHTLRSEYDHLAAAVELMRAEHTALQHALDGANAFGAGAAAYRLDALEVNVELMKGQLAAFQSTLDDLGQAIAPAAGLPGVPERFAELREQVNALDRQARAASRPPSTGESTLERAPAVPSGGSGFDYVGFERRFRGDSETVLATLADRYAPLLSEHQPVLDFGCGRGELVEVLAGRGIDAAGVDPDVGMVEEAVGHGRAVHLGDGLAYLRELEPYRLGALISVHVVEHLPLPVLVELLELAATRLRPGGIFIAETPNPMSLIVLGNSYILDPTHVWPLHPSLLTFLAERAGFRDVDLRFYSPADDYRLAPIVAGPDAPPWVAEINVALERLNHVLFGPQEYALIARTPPT
jgi:2-polyprenyl-3-methyl-5-hydroxy-6-metoxy-1,4-benzoquinol methylase